MNNKRITAVLLSAMMAASTAFGGMATAAPPETSNPGPGEDGFAHLTQYITPMDEQNVYKVQLRIEAAGEPLPADIAIVLDMSGSMRVGLERSAPGEPTRWAGALDGARAAMEIFTDPGKNPGADKTAVGTVVFATGADPKPLTKDRSTMFSWLSEFETYQRMVDGAIGLPTPPAGVTNDWNTQMDVALQTANTGVLNGPGRSTDPKARRYVIFLSDGMDTNDAGDALDEATQMKQGADKVTFMTIGLSLPPLSPSTTQTSFDENYASWNRPSTESYTNSPWIVRAMQLASLDENNPPSTQLGLYQGFFLAASDNPGAGPPWSLATRSEWGHQDISTKGYFDIPGDQYIADFASTLDEYGVIPTNAMEPAQELIFMAQRLIPGVTSTGTLTSTVAAPIGWGFSYGNGGAGVPVKKSRNNTGSFYEDNYLSAIQRYDLTGHEADTWYASRSEAPESGSVSEVYNADTVLRNASGGIVMPYFRPVKTKDEIIQAFEDYANAIVRFGENVRVSVKSNPNFEILNNYNGMSGWYNVTGFDGQSVTRNGDGIRWDPVAIPMIGANVLTYYVRFTGDQTDETMYYPVNDEIYISFDDNFDPYNIVPRVKNFAGAFVNPKKHDVKQDNTVHMNDVSDSSSTNLVINPAMDGSYASSQTAGSGNVTGMSVISGGFAPSTQPYTASVEMQTKGKKKTSAKEDAVEKLDKDALKKIQGRSLQVKTGKTAVYAEPKKDAKESLYLTKGKSFKVAGVTKNYYMIQYKKKDGKVQKGYVLKADVDLVKGK